MMTDPVNTTSVSPCCFRTASDASAAFCGDCGKPLLRCMAWSECGGLVGEDGRCTVCVRPQLFLDKGAVREVKVGGRMVLPLLFRNDAAVGRPLFVTRVWVKEGNGERVPQELAWERLDGGAALPWSLQTSPLDVAGRVRIEISFAVATRYRWRQETFLFVAELDIEAEGGGELVINQTIHASDTATAYAPIRIDPSRGGKAAAAVQPAQLALVRGERLERSEAVRGYPDDGAIQRSARFHWKGFAPGETPMDGPITSPDSLLGMGRALTRRDGGEGDARLLVRDRDGAIDDGLSAAISRRHLDLFVQDGRLYLHAAGGTGILINDRLIQRGTIAAIKDGDTVSILPKAKDAISLGFSFKAHHRIVEDITVQRTPTFKEASRR
jgi:hypothetical protein